jgi:hypothetical protein
VTQPFIIYSLGRSRSAWLSAFLTYRDWRCDHEAAVTLRSMDEARAFLAQPRHGTIESGVSPGWPLIRAMCPGIREVVIFRPVEDVIQSYLGVDIAPRFTYDVPALRRNLTHFEHCLRRLAARPGVLSLDFDDLGTELGCRAVWERCLPYPFDREHWLDFKDRNIQCGLPALLAYYHDHRETVEAFKREAKSELRALARRRALVDAQMKFMTRGRRRGAEIARAHV